MNPLSSGLYPLPFQLHHECKDESTLNAPVIKSEFALKGKIDSLDMFVSQYLNDHNLNELLCGLLSRIDIRAHAPLLAVAEPSIWAIEKLA